MIDYALVFLTRARGPIEFTVDEEFLIRIGFKPNLACDLFTFTLTFVVSHVFLAVHLYTARMLYVLCTLST